MGRALNEIGVFIQKVMKSQQRGSNPCLRFTRAVFLPTELCWRLPTTNLVGPSTLSTEALVLLPTTSIRGFKLMLESLMLVRLAHEAPGTGGFRSFAFMIHDVHLYHYIQNREFPQTLSDRSEASYASCGHYQAQRPSLDNEGRCCGSFPSSPKTTQEYPYAGTS